MSNSRKTRNPIHPVLLGKGTYAIYQAPDGDGVIAYRPDGEEQDQHQVIPAKVWKVILAAMRGETTKMGPAELLKLFMGS